MVCGIPTGAGSREKVQLLKNQLSQAMSNLGLGYTLVEMQGEAYKFLGERLGIMDDTLPIQDIGKLQPSLPQEWTSLMEQLTSLQHQCCMRTSCTIYPTPFLLFETLQLHLEEQKAYLGQSDVYDESGIARRRFFSIS